MSNLVIPVATIEKLSPHTNADSLELAQILGWQMVVRKGEYRINDKIVYFPIDTILPQELSDQYGVTKYLSRGRIRCTKLRGEPSFGLAVKPDSDEWQAGQDVTEYYTALGVKKYEPPVRVTAGDAEPEHPLFPVYTDIENMRNFPDVFQENEMVVLTEKLHGTNSRVGIVDGEFMAGSHRTRRKRPDDFATNLYWYPLSLSPVRSLLEDMATKYKQVIIFGEIYGSKIQSLDYGHKGTLGYRAFDILIDGHYLDWHHFHFLCTKYNIDTVPTVTFPPAIPFNLDTIKKYSEGNTLLMIDNAHIREGVVVKPLHERSDPKIGRVVLKYVSDQYLFGKQSDYTEQ
jgi:RNA ligase (TIGR02306 family)